MKPSPFFLHLRLNIFLQSVILVYSLNRTVIIITLLTVTVASILEFIKEVMGIFRIILNISKNPEQTGIFTHSNTSREIKRAFT